MRLVVQTILKNRKLWGEIISNYKIRIDNFLPKNTDMQEEKKVLSDLVCSDKKISCVYFYDDIGSKLFEEITKLSEYYLTKTEIDLIKQATEKLKDKLRDIDIVEFGSGDCIKISIILNSVPKKFRNTITYIPFDVSFSAVEKSSNILSEKFPEINIHGIVADFNLNLDYFSKGKNKLFCFLGSTIGNFSLDESLFFLNKLNDIMQAGDLLLLGFDMVKDKGVIENAYNDCQNLTEKFNKNILNVVNNLVGTNFNPDDFEHIAFYNEKLSRIEMHLKAICDLEVFSPYIQDSISILKDEMIHTENSYKFTFDDINYLASSAGLDIENIFTDENKWFSLVLLMKN